MRVTRQFEGETQRRLIDCTLGRLIFNAAIPQDLGFQPRESMDDMFALEIDKEVVKKDLGKIVDSCFHVHGVNVCASVLDDIKRLGYAYSTKGAVTVSISDIVVPPDKGALLEQADEKVASIEARYRRGLMSEDERYKSVIESEARPPTTRRAVTASCRDHSSTATNSALADNPVADQVSRHGRPAAARRLPPAELANTARTSTGRPGGPPCPPLHIVGDTSTCSRTPALPRQGSRRCSSRRGDRQRDELLKPDREIRLAHHRQPSSGSKS